MEVEQNHLTFQVGEFACHTLVVLQGEFDDSVHLYLAGIELLCCHLILNDAYVFHALYGNVVQVLSAFGIGIVSVPACSYCREYLDVVLVVAWVEDKSVHTSYLQSLEQSIVR